VEVGDAEGFQVGDLRRQVAEGAAEAVEVADIGDHLLTEEPVGVEVASEVEGLQVGRALGPAGFKDGAQPGEEGVGVVRPP
jgi:hypothetical protein